MFVLRSEQIVDPRSAVDYDAYQLESLQASRRQPGFLQELRLVYLGNFARRLIYQTWESQQHRIAYARSDRRVRAPEGLLAGPAESGFYHLIAQSQDAPPEIGRYVIDRRFRVSNGHQEEFEAIEAGLCELARGQPGFVARWSLKFLGNDTSYIRVSIWQSWEQLLAWMATPAYINESDAILGRVVWTTADRYEIVATAVTGV